MTPNDPLRVVIMVVLLTLAVFMLAGFMLGRASAGEWPTDMPPPKFGDQMWDAAKAALSTPPEALACMQIRQHGDAAVCISELEWRRQHADDE